MFKITTLIENNRIADDGLLVEHGLSILIETEDGTILFDTGQTGAFLKNAEYLGIDLNNVDHLVLSHGHYDHGGGLNAFLARFGVNCQIWAREETFLPKYTKREGRMKFAGIHSTVKYNNTEKGLTEILPNVFLLTGFKRRCKSETIADRYIKIEDEFIPDNFEDEIMLVLKTKKGLVNILGCSHPGIMNMLMTVSEHFSESQYAVIGGTHLVAADTYRLAETAEFIKKINFHKIGVSHCTGKEGVKMFASICNGFFQNHTGTILEFD